MRRRSKVAVLSCVAVGAITALIATVLYVSSQKAAERNEETRMTLVDDLLRASQAQVAAERMVSLSRAYVLTHEPELSMRAQRSLAELQEMLRNLERRASALGEGPLFEPVLVSAKRYGDALQHFLDQSTSLPRGVADTVGRHVVPARDRLQTALEDLVIRRQQQIFELRAATRALTARVVPVMIGICALGLLIGLLLARSALQTVDDVVADSGYASMPPWEAEEPAPGIPMARHTAKIIDIKSIQLLPERGTVLHFSRTNDDGAEQR